MSSTALFWTILVSATVAAGLFAVIMRARRKSRVDARREELRGSTLAQILSDTQKALDRPGWERFSAVGRIRALGRSSTDAELLEAMKVLWEEACREDAERGREGRDSNEFDLYDSGLVRIMEVLEERVVRTRSL
jgi:hypothetical protein